MYFIECVNQKELNKIRGYFTQRKEKIEYKMCLKRYFVFNDLEVAERVASKYEKDVLSLFKT